MKLVGNLKFRSRPALFGAFIAWHLMVTLVAFAPAFIATPVRAAKPVTCFIREECIDSKTKGNCDKEHCFEARGECPAGQGLCYANPPAIPLIIAIGNKEKALDLSDYIAIVFNYGVGVAGLVATVMFMIGGFQVLTAGTSDRHNQGKERIKNAIVGMLLASGALLILRTVNPDILKLQMPKVEIVKRKTIAVCAFTETCAPCGVPYSVLKDKSTGETAKAAGQCQFAKVSSQITDADRVKYDLSQCIGKGCEGSGPAMIPSSGDEKRCSRSLFRCNNAQPNDKFECGHAPEQPANAPAAPAGTSGGYVCKACLPNGAKCGTTGRNDQCCGGFCGGNAATAGGTCATGQPGDACQSNGECVTGKCQTKYGNSCSAGEIGSPCAESSECKDGYKCYDPAAADFVPYRVLNFARCSSGAAFSLCGSNDQCQAGMHCTTGAVYAGYASVCVPNTIPDNRSDFKKAVCNQKLNGAITDDCCNSNEDCASLGGYCNTLSNNFCTTGVVGSVCAENIECASRKCVKHMCSSGENGSKCIDDKSCGSGHCYTKGDFNVCVSGGLGSRCNDNGGCNDTPPMDCRDNVCSAKGDAGPAPK